MGFFLVRLSSMTALGAVLVALGVAGPARAAQAEAALLPVMAPDLLEPQKRALDARIRSVAAESGVSLQASADTSAGLEDAKKAGAACNIASLACQAQMGVLLGAKQVIVARIASDWAGDRLELRVLDALRGSTVREAAQLLPKAEGEQRNRVIDGVIWSVLAPNKTGSLSVIHAGEGTLFVDGIEQKKGQTKIDGLAPGPHDLELRGPDKKVIESKRVLASSGAVVEVTLGDVGEDVAGADEPSSLPLVLVGGGAALAGVGVAGAGGLEAMLELNAMERGTRNVMQTAGIAFLGATAVGALVAGAGGVLMATSKAAPPANAETIGGAP